EYVIDWDPAVCIDLFDLHWYPFLLMVEARVRAILLERSGNDNKVVDRWLRQNENDEIPTAHRFDCLIIDELCAQLDVDFGIDVYGVRAAFQHRERLCEGSAFRIGDHVQIAIRHSETIDPVDLKPVEGL